MKQARCSNCGGRLRRFKGQYRCEYCESEYLEPGLNTEKIEGPTGGTPWSTVFGILFVLAAVGLALFGKWLAALAVFVVGIVGARLLVQKCPNCGRVIGDGPGECIGSNCTGALLTKGQTAQAVGGTWASCLLRSVLVLAVVLAACVAVAVS